MNGPSSPSWTRLYRTPPDAQDRERLALRALRCILEEKLLPLQDLERSALSHIVESVARRVR
jgi:hypothetical protein